MAATFYMSPVTLIVQYFTNLGLIAPGALIYTYAAGTVSTPVVTYTDSSGVVPNANPMSVSAAGRPQSPSGAPVAFWTQVGSLKLLVTDSAGNLLIGPIDNIPSIADPVSGNVSLQIQLANPASSNVSGVGPVAGADLVANAMKSYGVFADVRAANSPGSLAAGQTLIIGVEGGITVGDGLGGFYRWNQFDSSTDDGYFVLKPTSVTSFGRWDRMVPNLSGSTANRPTVGLAVGYPFYDTTLNKPIWVKSLGPTVWIDATGAVV